MKLTWLELSLAVFATYRLARLVAWDKIFETLRRNLGRRASGSKWWKFWADLAHCPYCLGVWFALMCTELLWYPGMSTRQLVLLWFGLAGAQFIWQHLTDENA